jgi:hypothetical protein
MVVAMPQRNMRLKFTMGHDRTTIRLDSTRIGLA